jgi:superfamily II DNA or RNA helicase
MKSKKRITIEKLDATTSKIDMGDWSIIEPCLSYKSFYYKWGRFRKERIDYIKKCVLYKRGKYAYILSGFIPRIKEYLSTRGIELEVYEEEPIEFSFDVMKAVRMFAKKQIELRDYQLKLIETGLTKKHGIIKATTGTGKSFIILGLIASLGRQANCLILCHNSSIVQQLYSQLKTFFTADSILKLTGDTPDELKIKNFDKRIVVATIQSFVKISPDFYIDYFFAVFVDEAHRVSSLEGQYSFVLSKMLAPVRLGFTSTPPNQDDAKFAYEGLLGPIIGELPLEEAMSKGVIAKPRIRLVKAQFQSGLKDLRDYVQVYYEGIVANESRNQQILDIVQDIIDREETVLIFVNKIEHGENLVRMAEQRNLSLFFVQGSSSVEIRERVKSELNLGLIKAVICTTVWKEGVDIPNLQNVINAGGGKSEISVLQSIGRGLRRTETKDSLTIYDFFDSGHYYLVMHSGERLCIYFEQEWL